MESLCADFFNLFNDMLNCPPQLSVKVFLEEKTLTPWNVTVNLNEEWKHNR